MKIPFLKRTKKNCYNLLLLYVYWCCTGALQYITANNNPNKKHDNINTFVTLLLYVCKGRIYRRADILDHIRLDRLPNEGSVYLVK